MGADTKGPRPIGREVPAPGPRAIRWKRDNRHGWRVSSGVSFVRLETAGGVSAEPLRILR